MIGLGRAVLLMTMLCGPALAAPGLLCARPEVLQEVGRTVRQWNAYNRIDDLSVQEAPTDRANAVICHVTMLSTGYQPAPDGWRAVRTEERRRFDVQVQGNRFYVQVPR